MLEADYKNLRIVALENRIRDNKRIIINLMTDNIFQLRFGFSGDQKTAKQLDRDELLLRMMNSRMKRIRMVQKLIKFSNDRKTELLVWGLHSDLIDYRKRVKVMQDIVILVQEKHLLLEVSGSKKYVQVGNIERKLDWPIRIKSQFALDNEDHYSRKLRTEIDRQNGILKGVEEDQAANQQITKEMKAFITAVFGNDGWIRLVEARWLRKRQQRHDNEFDPEGAKVVPVYVKGGYNPHVPHAIIDELPTHSADYFGG